MMMPRWSVLREGVNVVALSTKSILFVSRRSSVASFLVGGVCRILSPSSSRLLKFSLLKSPPIKIVQYGFSLRICSELDTR